MDAAKETLETLFSSILDGILLISPDGRILKTNLAAQEMFQQSSEAFTDKPASDLFPGQPDVNAKIESTCGEGLSFRDVECQGFRKLSQAPFPVNLTLSPFLNPDTGAPTGAVLQVRDRSLVMELEEATRHLDQLSQLGVLSLGMAHEIKNPLVAISGSAQLLKSRLDDPDHKEYLDIVIKEVDRINRMVERMLGFANPGPPKVDQINIHKILEEILLLEKEMESKSIRFIQEYDPSLPLITGDEDQLKQVFLNLVRNARESMPEGGDIRLVTRFHSKYLSKTRTKSSPHQDIVVEIIDQGLGIDATHLKNLFVPFHTTKPKGSGLGLAISLKIVEDHNGKIKVLSTKAQGTTVQVFLPIQQSA